MSNARLAVLLFGSLVGLQVLPGCSSVKAQPPVEVSARVAFLTRVLEGKTQSVAPENRPAAFETAVELGQIGLRWKLPGETMSVLASQSEDISVSGLEFLDTVDVGNGTLVYRACDGPRVAFLMWELRGVPRGLPQISILWRELASPTNGDGVRQYCIDRLAEAPSHASVPYLLAASANWHAPGAWYVAGRATTALAQLFPDTRDALVSLIDSPIGSVSRIARDTLQTKGLDTVRLKADDAKGLAKYLEHDSWFVRRAAAAAIAQFTSHAAVDMLVRALRDADPLVRQAAAIGLGKTGDARARASLKQACSEDPSCLVRLSALDSLRRVSAKAPLEVLERSLRDEDAWVRSAAVHMIAETDGLKAEQLLIRALGDLAPGVRASAAEALARRGVRGAVPALVAALQESAPGRDATRTAAIEALGELGDPRATTPLIESLSHADVYVRLLAARALGKIGDARALGRLREIAAKDPDESVRQVAEDAIVQITESGPEE